MTIETVSGQSQLAPLNQHGVALSVVTRGDVSGLSPEDKATYIIKTCESLGLNPATQPLALIKFQGKEILYVTRGATDQLARRNRVSRKITEGPKVIDFAGVKLVYAVCEATMTDDYGTRSETSVATVPLAGADGGIVLMKAETKAKRRATLALLGLGLLDESEVDGAQSEKLPPVDLSRDISPRTEHDGSANPALDYVRDNAPSVESVEQAIACYVDANELDWKGVDSGAQEAAQNILIARLESLGFTKFKTAFKKSCRENTQAKKDAPAPMTNAEFEHDERPTDLGEHNRSVQAEARAENAPPPAAFVAYIARVEKARFPGELADLWIESKAMRDGLEKPLRVQAWNALCHHYAQNNNVTPKDAFDDLKRLVESKEQAIAEVARGKAVVTEEAVDKPFVPSKPLAEQSSDEVWESFGNAWQAVAPVNAESLARVWTSHHADLKRTQEPHDLIVARAELEQHGADHGVTKEALEAAIQAILTKPAAPAPTRASRVVRPVGMAPASTVRMDAAQETAINAELARTAPKSASRVVASDTEVNAANDRGFKGASDGPAFRAWLDHENTWQGQVGAYRKRLDGFLEAGVVKARWATLIEAVAVKINTDEVRATESINGELARTAPGKKVT